MTSLLKKTLLSLALFASGTVFCPEPIFIAVAPPHMVDLKTRMKVPVDDFFLKKSDQEPSLLEVFLETCLVKRKLTEKEAKAFVRTNPQMQKWLNKCKLHWEDERLSLHDKTERLWYAALIGSGIVAERRESIKKTLNSDENLDLLIMDNYCNCVRYITTLKKCSLYTLVEKKRKRVVLFLQQLLIRINSIYLSVTKEQESSFKKLTEKGISTIIFNLVHFATPVCYPIRQTLYYDYTLDETLNVLDANIEPDFKDFTLHYMIARASNPLESLKRLLVCMEQNVYARYFSFCAAGGPAAAAGT